MKTREIDPKAYEQYLRELELPRIRRLLYRALLKRRTVQQLTAEFDLSFEEWNIPIIDELQSRSLSE